MVIEHTFISTLPAEEIMQRAKAYLAARGFARLPSDGKTHVLEMERGARRAAKATSIADLPQRVRVDYDRGRVSVAGLIEANAIWGGSGSFGFVSERPKKMIVHERMLWAIVLGLETLLAYDRDGQADYTNWDLVEATASDMAYRRKRNMWIAFGCIVFAVVCVITASVYFGRR